MKKNITISSLVFLLSLSLNAQLRIGVLGGINSPHFKTSAVDDTFDEKVRTTFGAIFDYNLYENLYLDMRILYQEIYTGGSPNQSDAEYLYKTFFINIPLSVKYKFGEEINPYILGGVSLNYNLKTDLDLEMNSIRISGDLSGSIEDISFSAFLGCGVQLNFVKYIIFTEGNYSFGLTNVLIPGSYELSSGTISTTMDVDEGSSVKISTLNVLAGVKIPFTL